MYIIFKGEALDAKIMADLKLLTSVEPTYLTYTCRLARRLHDRGGEDIYIYMCVYHIYIYIYTTNVEICAECICLFRLHISIIYIYSIYIYIQ